MCRKIMGDPYRTPAELPSVPVQEVVDDRTDQEKIVDYLFTIPINRWEKGYYLRNKDWIRFSYKGFYVIKTSRQHYYLRYNPWWLEGKEIDTGKLAKKLFQHISSYYREKIQKEREKRDQAELRRDQRILQTAEQKTRKWR
jgi:hypothetical protein